MELLLPILIVVLVGLFAQVAGTDSRDLDTNPRHHI
jgi:hypothetical protein